MENAHEGFISAFLHWKQEVGTLQLRKVNFREDKNHP